MTQLERTGQRLRAAAQPDQDRPHRAVDIAGHSLEVVQLNAAVIAVNIEALLPEHWKNLLVAEGTYLGKDVDFQGGAVETSAEDSSFVTRYKVVEGTTIEKNMPWVYDLWEGPIKELVTKVTGEEVRIDDEKDEDGKMHGLNINITDRDNQRSGYERHTDFNKYTALVAGTTIGPDDGGELVMEMEDGSIEEIRIQAGWVYIFNGREHKHGVNKLTSVAPKYRITIPMDYVPNVWKEQRPMGLSKVLGTEIPEKTNGLVNGATVHELFPDGPDDPGEKAS